MSSLFFHGRALTTSALRHNLPPGQPQVLFLQGVAPRELVGVVLPHEPRPPIPFDDPLHAPPHERPRRMLQLSTVPRRRRSMARWPRNFLAPRPMARPMRRRSAPSRQDSHLVLNATFQVSGVISYFGHWQFMSPATIVMFLGCKMCSLKMSCLMLLAAFIQMLSSLRVVGGWAVMMMDRSLPLVSTILNQRLSPTTPTFSAHSKVSLLISVAVSHHYSLL